jgi:hypothetical protein
MSHNNRLAREAGHPNARIEHPRDRWRRFMDAAFEEHFQREATDNIYWDQGGPTDGTLLITTAIATSITAAANPGADGSGASGAGCGVMLLMILTSMGTTGLIPKRRR